MKFLKIKHKKIKIKFQFLHKKQKRTVSLVASSELKIKGISLCFKAKIFT